MHPQQTRLIYLFSAILLVCCALLAIPGAISTPEPTDGIVGPMPVGSVERLTLQTPEGTLEAHRRGEDWYLTRPITGLGDSKVLDDLVEMLSRWDVTSSLSSASPEDHGLAPATYTVEIRAIDGSSPTLRIGAVAPGGAHTYAQVDDGPVLILEGDVTPLLARPLDLYRRRTLHVFAQSAVTRVDWQLDGQTWSATRGSAGGWLLPDGTAARTGAVEGALAALAATSLESFQDNINPSLSGLAPPRGRVVLSTLEGEWELSIGMEKLGGTLVRTSDGLTGTIGDLSLLVPTQEALQLDQPGD